MAATGQELLRAAVGDPSSDRSLHQRHGLSGHCSRAELERLLKLVRLAEVAGLS